MKSYSFKRIHVFALLLLLVPCFANSVYAANLQYSSLAALLKDFATLDKCTDASCTDFVQALKQLVATNAKYKAKRAEYTRFITELEQKVATRNANLIALFLAQGKGLFPEVAGLLKGRSKNDILDIINKRLKK